GEYLGHRTTTRRSLAARRVGTVGGAGSVVLGRTGRDDSRRLRARAYAAHAPEVPPMAASRLRFLDVLVDCLGCRRRVAVRIRLARAQRNACATLAFQPLASRTGGADRGGADCLGFGDSARVA